MKAVFIGILMTLIVLGAGCKKDDSSASGRDGGTTEDREARRQRVEAEKRQLYDETENRLKDTDRRIEELDTKAQNSSPEKRAKYEDRIRHLQQKEIDLRADLRRIKSASIEAWEDLKPRVQGALNDLTQGVENAISEFRFRDKEETRKP